MNCHQLGQDMNTLFRSGLLAGLLLVAAIGDAFAGSVSNLRFVADPSGSATALARVRYSCIEGWAGEVQTLARDGQVLTITLSNDPNLLCFTTPPPPEDRDFPLGNLEAGTYEFRLQQAPRQAGGEPIQHLAGTFTIASAAPYSDLRAVPHPARAFEPVSARLHYICAAGFAVAPPTTTVAGNTITVRIPVTLDPCFLGVPPPPFDIDLPLGNFAAGNYTVVALQESAAPGVVIPALSTPLLVSGSGSHSIPATQPWSLLLMIGGMVLVGWLSLGRRD